MMRRLVSSAVIPSAVLAALLCASLTQATVYKWTDAEGRTQYGDQPPANARNLRAIDAAPRVAEQAAPGESAQNAAEIAQKRARERARDDSEALQRLRRDRLAQEQLETERLKQVKLRTEIESERLKQEASERCARRGDCGDSGAGAAAPVIIVGRSRPTDPRLAAPHPVNPNQRFGPPGFSTLNDRR
jgi:Domain of unknown function (DUF4124)